MTKGGLGPVAGGVAIPPSAATPPVQASLPPTQIEPAAGVYEGVSKNSGTDRARLAALQTLEKLHLDPAQARRVFSNVLAAAPLVETYPEVEDLAAALARSETPALMTAAKAALAAAGPRGLVALVAALPSYLAAPNDKLVEATRIACLEVLAAFTPQTVAERIDKPIALHELAYAPALTTAHHSARYFFSNEPGLHDAAAQLTVRGGLALGVSGGLLEPALATQADAILLVDVDPSIAGFFHALVAIVAALDAIAPAATAPERAELLRNALTQPRDAARMLSQVGVSVQTMQTAVTALTNGVNYRGRGTWLDSPAAVEHLSQLARSGKLLAMAANWADSLVAPRLKAVVRGLGLPLGTVNLSNLLDYLADRAPIKNALAEMPAKADAQVLATRFERFYVEPPTVLGSFEKPCATPLACWTSGEAWQELDTSDAAEALKYPPRPPYVPPEPSDEQRERNRRFAASRVLLETLAALGVLARLDQSCAGGLSDQLPVPKEGEDLVALARRCEASWWTDERKVTYWNRLHGTGAGSQERAADPELLALVKNARTGVEVQMLALLAGAPGVKHWS